MSDELEALDPELARAFALEQQRPAPSDAARLRASLRLLQALSPAAIPVANPSWGRRLVRAVRGVNPVLSAAVSFAVGVGVGAAVNGPAPAPAPVRSPVVQPAVTTVFVPTTPEATLEPTPTPVPSAQPAEPQAAPPPPAKAPSASGSANASAERVLLDVAYAALGQGQAARALEPLQQHARQFPEGALREEREALTIQCLRNLGRLAEAQRRGASFKARYPSSLFGPRVERALAEQPPSETGPTPRKP
jgi:hypothetical protein